MAGQPIRNELPHSCRPIRELLSVTLLRRKMNGVVISGRQFVLRLQFAECEKIHPIISRFAILLVMFRFKLLEMFSNC